MLHNVEKIQIRPREKVTTEPTAPPKQENDTNLLFSFPATTLKSVDASKGSNTDCVRPCTILKVYTRGKLPQASTVLHTGVNASAIAQTNIKYPNMRLVPKISASLSPGT